MCGHPQVCYQEIDNKRYFKCDAVWHTVWVLVCVRVCTCVCVYACVSVCVCMCMYVYACVKVMLQLYTYIACTRPMDTWTQIINLYTNKHCTMIDMLD